MRLIFTFPTSHFLRVLFVHYYFLKRSHQSSERLTGGFFPSAAKIRSKSPAENRRSDNHGYNMRFRKGTTSAGSRLFRSIWITEDLLALRRTDPRRRAKRACISRIGNFAKYRFLSQFFSPARCGGIARQTCLFVTKYQMMNCHQTRRPRLFNHPTA